MLDTGNTTHTTVAFFKQIDKWQLSQALFTVISWVQENDLETIGVKGSLGEMWGKNSALIKEESELFHLHKKICSLLSSEGTFPPLQSRPPHIEVVKKVIDRPTKGCVIHGHDIYKNLE